MAPKAPQTPEAMVQAFVERFTKAHPNIVGSDLVALIFEGVEIAEAQRFEKVAA